MLCFKLILSLEAIYNKNRTHGLPRSDLKLKNAQSTRRYLYLFFLDIHLEVNVREHNNSLKL